MRVGSGGQDIFARSGGRLQKTRGGYLTPFVLFSLILIQCFVWNLFASHTTQMHKGWNSRKSLDDNDVMRIISTSSFGW